MILTKLCPNNYKSLLIRSDGKDKGTKVSFYIENRNAVCSINSSELKRENTIRQQCKAKATFLNSQTINGTMIQISDMMASSRKLNWIQKATMKSNKTILSEQDSLFMENNPINDLEEKMNELNHVTPVLITEIVNVFSPKTNNIDSCYSKSARDMQNSKIVNYEKCKLIDDYDSANFIKQVFEKRRCSCKRILSVDDEIFNQRSIQFLLSQQGFEVILAFNGEEALETIQKIEKCNPNCNLFMVILMDYQMPIMDGIQTTKELKNLMQQMVLPQIHVIGLTAFNSKKDIQNCLEAGMSDVLAKPLKIKEFFEILNLL